MMSNLTLAFFNPPHADWCLANNMTWLFMQSHYNAVGKHKDLVTWLEAPYKFDKYASLEDVYPELAQADVILFSSYVWNYDMCDEMAKLIKERHPEKLTIVGGPHIGTMDKAFLDSRTMYDYVCKPTKPGETFMEEFIDEYFASGGKPNPEHVAWELRAVHGKKANLPEASVYEEHFEYLKKTADYSHENNLEPFIVIETTRGCPYQCVFCEWGGGTGTKIIKKELETVKRDVMALKRAGYRDVYLTDANFGVFEERDIEIFRFAVENQINLTDISTLKSKDINRRKRLVDAWFEVAGKARQTELKPSEVGSWRKYEFVSVVPTVSIQSISDAAMKIAKRVDLSLDNKLELSRHIHDRCHHEGFPVPSIELILGMPGSTLDDFYNEMEIIWNFKAWNSFRHDYMFLPDSELSNPEYLKQYGIELVEVYTDLVDEQGVDNMNGLYGQKKNYFKTIRSCFSYTARDMEEMFFMNLAANTLLRDHYGPYDGKVHQSIFGKTCYEIISQFPEFATMNAEIRDILDPSTPTRSIKKLEGRTRNDAVENLLAEYNIIIKSELFKRLYV